MLKMDKYRGVCEKGTVPYWQASETEIVLYNGRFFCFVHVEC